MKKIIRPVIAGVALCFACTAASAQEFKEHVSKEFTPSSKDSRSVFCVYNINGNVRVEGYAGDKVTVEIDKTITAKTADVLETGKKEFNISFEQVGDTIFAYIAGPHDSRPRRSWHSDEDYHRIEYNYKAEFVVRVPMGLSVCASTVNNGSVDVKDVAGILHVNNVNGPITIENAKNTTNARTVNGSVHVNYLANPPEKSSYSTVNGEIRITYPASLAADVSYKTMNGEVFTDFQNTEMLPATVSKTEDKRSQGTVYRINSESRIRIGSGGNSLHFETLNGNIYIKKQS